MEQAKIDRINQLSQFSRERELTAEEQSERELLRKEYIADWRKGAEATLQNTYVIGPDGVKRKIQKKK